MADYRFSFDSGQCLNCGVCVDVCPVHCLDMSRPQGPGPEPSEGEGAQQTWMMVSPVQVGHCTGCMVCVMECPTDIIEIDKIDGAMTYAPSPGPLVRERAYDPDHWQALSDFTRVSRKDRPLGDPWGASPKWRPVRRSETWQVWRTWRTNDDYARSRAGAKAKTTSEEDDR